MSQYWSPHHSDEGKGTHGMSASAHPFQPIQGNHQQQPMNPNPHNTNSMLPTNSSTNSNSSSTNLPHTMVDNTQSQHLPSFPPMNNQQVNNQNNVQSLMPPPQPFNNMSIPLDIGLPPLQIVPGLHPQQPQQQLPPFQLQMSHMQQPLSGVIDPMALHQQLLACQQLLMNQQQMFLQYQQSSSEKQDKLERQLSLERANKSQSISASGDTGVASDQVFELRSSIEYLEELLQKQGELQQKQDATHQAQLNALASSTAQRDALHQAKFDSLYNDFVEINKNVAEYVESSRKQRSSTEDHAVALDDLTQRMATLQSRVESNVINPQLKTFILDELSHTVETKMQPVQQQQHAEFRSLYDKLTEKYVKQHNITQSLQSQIKVLSESGTLGNKGGSDKNSDKTNPDKQFVDKKYVNQHVSEMLKKNGEETKILLDALKRDLKEQIKSDKAGYDKQFTTTKAQYQSLTEKVNTNHNSHKIVQQSLQQTVQKLEKQYQAQHDEVKRMHQFCTQQHEEILKLSDVTKQLTDNCHKLIEKSVQQQTLIDQLLQCVQQLTLHQQSFQHSVAAVQQQATAAAHSTQQHQHILAQHQHHIEMTHQILSQHAPLPPLQPLQPIPPLQIISSTIPPTATKFTANSKDHTLDTSGLVNSGSFGYQRFRQPTSLQRSIPAGPTPTAAPTGGPSSTTQPPITTSTATTTASSSLLCDPDNISSDLDDVEVCFTDTERGDRHRLLQIVQSVDRGLRDEREREKIVQQRAAAAAQNETENGTTTPRITPVLPNQQRQVLARDPPDDVSLNGDNFAQFEVSEDEQRFQLVIDEQLLADRGEGVFEELFGEDCDVSAAGFEMMTRGRPLPLGGVPLQTITVPEPHPIPKLNIDDYPRAKAAAEAIFRITSETLVTLPSPIEPSSPLANLQNLTPASLASAAAQGYLDAVLPEDSTDEEKMAFRIVVYQNYITTISEATQRQREQSPHIAGPHVTTTSATQQDTGAPIANSSLSAPSKPRNAPIMTSSTFSTSIWDGTPKFPPISLSRQDWDIIFDEQREQRNYALFRDHMQAKENARLVQETQMARVGGTNDHVTNVPLTDTPPVAAISDTPHGSASIPLQCPPTTPKFTANAPQSREQIDSLIIQRAEETCIKLRERKLTLLRDGKPIPPNFEDDYYKQRALEEIAKIIPQNRLPPSLQLTKQSFVHDNIHTIPTIPSLANTANTTPTSSQKTTPQKDQKNDADRRSVGPAPTSDDVREHYKRQYYGNRQRMHKGQQSSENCGKSLPEFFSTIIPASALDIGSNMDRDYLTSASATLSLQSNGYLPNSPSNTASTTSHSTTDRKRSMHKHAYIPHTTQPHKYNASDFLTTPRSFDEDDECESDTGIDFCDNLTDSSDDSDSAGCIADLSPYVDSLMALLPDERIKEVVDSVTAKLVFPTTSQNGDILTASRAYPSRSSSSPFENLTVNKADAQAKNVLRSINQHLAQAFVSAGGDLSIPLQPAMSSSLSNGATIPLNSSNSQDDSTSEDAFVSIVSQDKCGNLIKNSDSSADSPQQQQDSSLGDSRSTPALSHHGKKRILASNTYGVYNNATFINTNPVNNNNNNNNFFKTTTAASPKNCNGGGGIHQPMPSHTTNTILAATQNIQQRQPQQQQQSQFQHKQQKEQFLKQIELRAHRVISSMVSQQQNILHTVLDPSTIQTIHTYTPSLYEDFLFLHIGESHIRVVDHFLSLVGPLNIDITPFSLNDTLAFSPEGLLIPKVSLHLTVSVLAKYIREEHHNIRQHFTAHFQWMLLNRIRAPQRDIDMAYEVANRAVPRLNRSILVSMIAVIESEIRQHGFTPLPYEIEEKETRLNNLIEIQEEKHPLPQTSLVLINETQSQSPHFPTEQAPPMPTCAEALSQGCYPLTIGSLSRYAENMLKLEPDSPLFSILVNICRFENSLLPLNYWNFQLVSSSTTTQAELLHEHQTESPESPISVSENVDEKDIIHELCHFDSYGNRITGEYTGGAFFEPIEYHNLMYSVVNGYPYHDINDNLYNLILRTGLPYSHTTKHGNIHLAPASQSSTTMTTMFTHYAKVPFVNKNGLVQHYASYPVFCREVLTSSPLRGYIQKYLKENLVNQVAIPGDFSTTSAPACSSSFIATDWYRAFTNILNFLMHTACAFTSNHSLFDDSENYAYIKAFFLQILNKTTSATSITTTLLKRQKETNLPIQTKGLGDIFTTSISADCTIIIDQPTSPQQFDTNALQNQITFSDVYSLVLYFTKFLHLQSHIISSVNRHPLANTLFILFAEQMVDPADISSFLNFPDFLSYMFIPSSPSPTTQSNELITERPEIEAVGLALEPQPKVKSAKQIKKEEKIARKMGKWSKKGKKQVKQTNMDDHKQQYEETEEKINDNESVHEETRQDGNHESPQNGEEKTGKEYEADFSHYLHFAKQVSVSVHPFRFDSPQPDPHQHLLSDTGALMFISLAWDPLIQHILETPDPHHEIAHYTNPIM